MGTRFCPFEKLRSFVLFYFMVELFHDLKHLCVEYFVAEIRGLRNYSTNVKKYVQDHKNWHDSEVINVHVQHGTRQLYT